MKLSALNSSSLNPQHIMLHGMPKSGKSTLASKLAVAGYHLWWLSLDNGHSVLGKLPPEAQVNIDIVVMPDTREFPVAATTVFKLFKMQAARICDTHGQIDCATCRRNSTATWSDWDFKKLTSKDIVVVDHISGLAESVMNQICTKDYEKNAEYKLNFNDYGTQGSLMHAFLSYVQQAPFNCICIAHSLEVKAEDGTTMLVPQIGTRAFSDTAGKYFDHIVYCHIHNGQHKAGSSTLYRAGILTGSRSDVAVEKEKDFSLEKFFTTNVVGQYAVIKEETKAVLQEAAAAIVKEVSPEVRAVVPVREAAPVETEVIIITREPKEQAVVVVKGNTPAAPVTNLSAEPELSMAEKIKARLAAMKKG